MPPNPSNLEDGLLTESSLREMHLEYFDKWVYNDLPQYLIRISDMRLYGRDELWENFRPLVDTIPISVQEARKTMTGWYNERDRRSLCKRNFKHIFRFAIFSHRWGSKEPVFRDMSSKIYGSKPCPEGPGYEKLLQFCNKAKEYGCDYVWTDTCCINKESSAELEEAIRSMYRWYEDAHVCIVHLARSSSVDDFPEEPWFTRGWTLQELLASRKLRMYGRDWNPIWPDGEKENCHLLPNDKRNLHMLNAISKVTGIDPGFVRKFRSDEVPLSEKMRWASKRKTTRIEDVAYSLLGILDVSMTIAYGEGDMAFRRLLDAIAQYSLDPSFFAWAGETSGYSLALLSSPSSFTTKVTRRGAGDHGYTIQKLGVQVKLLLIPVKVCHRNRHYTLQPLDAHLSDIQMLPSRIRQSPYMPGKYCELGVVNFGRPEYNCAVDEGAEAVLRAGKRYFGVLVMPRPVLLPSILGRASIKLGTGGVLLE